MGGLTMSRKCFRFVGVVLAAAVFAAIAGVARADTLLFQDTFNNVTDADTYGAPGYGVNEELNQTYRQTGTYANTAYTQGAGAYFREVNNTTLPGAAGKLAMTQSGWVSPNHNFNGTDAAGGLKVSFDLLPGADAAASTVAVTVGANSGGSWLPNQGLSLAFIRSYSGYNFNGDVHYYVNGGAENDAHYTDTPTVWHNVTLLFTDSVDNKPFNGSGDLHVQGFMDGSTTSFMTAGLGMDVANNYITLFGGSSAASWSLFDNLTVSQVPEPGVLLLLATGLIGLLAYAWRKRKP